VNKGSTLIINTVGGPFNNLAVGTLTGGTCNVTGTIELGNSITTNAATMTLTGTAAEILNSTTSTNALSAIASNNATGTLSLQSGQALATTASFSNSGKTTVGLSSSFTVGGAYADGGDNDRRRHSPHPPV
jgi:hypothetical protein